MIHISLDQKVAPLPDLTGDKVRKADPDPERASDEILGTADVSRRNRRPAGRLGHPSGRALPLAIFHGHFQREVFPGARRRPTRAAAGGRRARASICPNGHEGELCAKYGYERVLQETRLSSTSAGRAAIFRASSW